MTTGKDYINFITGQLSAIDGTETRRMTAQRICF